MSTRSFTQYDYNIYRIDRDRQMNGQDCYTINVSFQVGWIKIFLCIQYNLYNLTYLNVFVLVWYLTPFKQGDNHPDMSKQPLSSSAL